MNLHIIAHRGINGLQDMAIIISINGYIRV